MRHWNWLGVARFDTVTLRRTWLSAVASPRVDDHAERVTRPLAQAWSDFQSGQASLLDLSRRAEQAASALDNANALLIELLAAAAHDLEYAYFTSERAAHDAEARRILRPVLAIVGDT